MPFGEKVNRPRLKSICSWRPKQEPSVLADPFGDQATRVKIKIPKKSSNGRVPNRSLATLSYVCSASEACCSVLCSIIDVPRFGLPYFLWFGLGLALGVIPLGGGMRHVL